MLDGNARRRISLEYLSQLPNLAVAPGLARLGAHLVAGHGYYVTRMMTTSLRSGIGYGPMWASRSRRCPRLSTWPSARRGPSETSRPRP